MAEETSNCPQRLRLGQAVVDTIQAMYAAKRDFDLALLGKGGNPNQLSAILKTARQDARKAQKAFDLHVSEHHCSL